MLRIQDIYPVSRIRIKEFKYFNPKKWVPTLGNMIRVVHPGSGSRIRIPDPYPDPGSGSWPFTHPGSWPFTHPGSWTPDPGVKKAPDPHHCKNKYVARTVPGSDSAASSYQGPVLIREARAYPVPVVIQFFKTYKILPFYYFGEYFDCLEFEFGSLTSLRSVNAKLKVT